MTRVAGAALHRRVEKQLREELAKYGLDVSRYRTCEVEPVFEHDPCLLLSASFTDGKGHTIQVDNIYTDDDGNLTQYGRPELV